MKRVMFSISDELMPVIVSLILDKVEALTIENIDGPEPPEREHRKLTKHIVYGQSISSVIAKSVAVGKTIDIVQMRAILEKAGYNGSSASSAMSGLVHNDFFVKVRRGVFRKLKDVPDDFKFVHKVVGELQDK